jgi:hypothetical protein
MIRVYFDWNVLVYLKHHKESHELYKSIYSIIKTNNKKLLFPYSPAHLQDLKQGFSGTGQSKTLTYRDLEFLHEITQDHCLYEDYKQKKVIPLIINPRKYFDQLTEDKTLDEFDFKTLFSSDNKEISEIWEIYFGILKLLPTGINFEQIDSVPAKYEALKEIFPTTKTENNFFNLMNDLMKVMSQLEEHSSNYKSVRNSFITDMKIDTDPKNWGNAFDYLDKLFVKKKLNLTFLEMLDSILKITHKDKKLSRFEYFVYYYISLDTYGYYRDKKLPNLIADATHAYYGAFCDFFVTEDDNTYHKAKAVYEYLNIKTKVCKPTEFPATFYSITQLGNNNVTESISSRIVQIIRQSLILMNSFDDELNPVSVHKINHPLVDYFNRMQISFYNEGTVLFFYKKRENYSDFLFWSELKSIVDKVVFDFGVDDKLRGEFNEQDIEELKDNNNWQGRTWKRNEITTDIFYNDEPFGLTLRVRLNKND